MALPFPKAYADVVGRLRVPMGFVLIAAFALLSHPDWQSIPMGVLVAMPGMALRAWAAGHLEKNTKLTTSGPYAYMRNPLYAGSLVVALGMVFAARSMVLGFIFAGFFLLVYLPVIGNEESHLYKLFPDFGEYTQRVPLIWPSMRPYPSDKPFSFALFLKNQEYKAWLALGVGVLVLAAKTFF